MNLDEMQKQLEQELKEEEERAKLYDEQAKEIAVGLVNGKKVNDGYYTWGLKIDQNKCTIIAARNMLIFSKGYRPQIAQFELNKEFSLFDNVKEVVETMLRHQNGEYNEKDFEIEEE